MNTKNLFLLPAVLLMAACGGTYQVSSSDPKGTPERFAIDEIECNKTNAFVSSSGDSAKKIYMTERYFECMKAKGWNFNKTSTKVSFIKSAD